MKKTLTQIIIYLIEIFLITLTIITLYSKIETGTFFSWFDDFFTLNFISDFGVIFVVYQIMVYSFFTLSDSAKIDALIKINSVIKTVFLLIEYNQPLNIVKDELCNLLDEKKDHYMFSKENIKMLNEIKVLVDNYGMDKHKNEKTLFRLRYLELTTEHFKDFYQLTWRNSFLLRVIK